MTAPPGRHRRPGTHVGTTFYPGAGPSTDEMTWLTALGDVDEVFRSKDWEQGGGGRRDSFEFIGHSLLSLSGEDHFERRRLEAALFRRPELRRYEREVLASALAGRLAGAARRRGPDGRVRLELLRFLRSALYRVSAAIAGIDGVEDESRLDTYLECLDRIQVGTSAEWVSEDHRTALDRALVHKRVFAEQFFRPSWERREELVRGWRAGAVATSELPVDLITLMLRNRAAFERWGEDVFVRETILFHGAATNTIANAVPHVLTELAAWAPEHPGHEAAMTHAGFLRLAANEALRLHPPSPFLIRRAIRDTVVPSGARFAAGEYAVLDIVAASRDPRAFGERPDEFDPYRRRAPGVKPAGIAFGDGPHTCIGMALAIGDAGARGEDEEEPVGAMVFILRELLRAGAVPDPGGGAVESPLTVRGEYETFPVVLTRL